MKMPAMKRQLAATYDSVLARIPEALAAEGFGVLTEIDVRETLKKKLGVEFTRYKILGACNPALAHQALTGDMDVGVLLPCNVVVYENEDKSTTVSAVDPAEAIGNFGDAEMRTVANEVRERLERVLKALG